MKPLHVLLLLLVIFFWGGNFAVVKAGLDELPPILFVTLRFALVAALLLPFARPPRGRFRALFVLAFTLGLVHFSLIFTGVSMVDAAVASILVQIQVPFAALLAAVFFRDMLGWRRGLGMALAILGVAIIAGAPQQASSLLGVVLVILASFMWSVANVQMKYLADLDAMTLNAWMALMAAPMLLALSLVTESGQWGVITQVSWRAWAAVAYQAVAVVILGYSVWYAMLRRYAMNQVTPFSLLLPIASVGWAVVLLGEEITWSLAVGGLVTLAGVAIIMIRRPKTVAGSTLDT